MSHTEGKEIMESAQVFASAWSLVGGQFDFGNGMQRAEAAKADLKEMVAELVAERDELMKALRLWMRYFGDDHETVMLAIAEDHSVLTQPQEITSRILAKYPESESTSPRFPYTECSQCGGRFGPGDHGYSHCESHKGKPRT